MMPELFIIAGCNGAGKTTAAYNLLPEVFDTTEFINADEIARGINKDNVEEAAIAAARFMLSKIDFLIESKQSFAFETTLSGLTYIKIIEKAKANGFDVTLFFVYLESAAMAIDRVAFRVKKGGHHIPKDVIERRYLKGIINLPKYAAIVKNWYLLNNSGDQYLMIAKNIDGIEEIHNFELYKNLLGDEYSK
jgi:predicted ABC-type ATPase